MTRIDTAILTRDISSDDLCDMATESHGDTAQTVDALVTGVLARYADVLDAAALAALNAVRSFHVPQLQDAFDYLEAAHRAH